jgi:hypothetical protein
MFKLLRLELCWALTARLEAWPFGNILMLLMNRLSAQGGSTLSFPHQAITKVGRGPYQTARKPHLRFVISNLSVISAPKLGLKFQRDLGDMRVVKTDPTKEKPLLPARSLPGQRFVARQPILDREQNVFGYGLLFRNGVEDFFNADPELELAARAMLDTSLLYGINTLRDNRRAFVNCTREVLSRILLSCLQARPWPRFWRRLSRKIASSPPANG